MIAALESDRYTERIDRREDVTLIINRIENFKIDHFLFFWADILSSAVKIPKILQTNSVLFMHRHFWSTEGKTE